MEIILSLAKILKLTKPFGIVKKYDARSYETKLLKDLIPDIKLAADKKY